MKKIIYHNTEQFSYQVYYNRVSAHNSILDFVYSSFIPMYDWMMFDIKGEDYIIWNQFVADEYSSFKDVPKLKISKKNYNEIEQVLRENSQKEAPFLVFTQDDSGWITLERKQELSADDLKFIEEENERCLKDYK